VAASPAVAQLRWFLVDPSVRGAGLGKRLLNEAVAFSRTAGYETIVLWTVAALTAAARLYKSVGFERVEAERAKRWGVDVIEERYELSLK
jgi:GNAT superfamily N-acetyltransferase